MNINEEGKYYAAMVRKYDVGELIQRIACLVHMRRPFYKLKDVSEDAMRMLKLFDAIFHEDKLIKAEFSLAEEIRRIAKYRNNSYFVCSPESGVRFARLMSYFANIRKHNLDPVEYLSDVFRRIKTTAKDKLVDLLEHRWQPATVGAWTKIGCLFLKI